jgi:hypothetical protein
MDAFILRALRVPVRVLFGGNIDSESQGAALSSIERLAPFSANLPELDLIDAMLKIGSGKELQELVEPLLSHVVVTEPCFFKEVELAVCADEVQNCMSVGTLLDENAAARALNDLLRTEVERVLADEEGRWSLRSLSRIFNANPEEDKVRADAMFLSGRHRDAYRLYSKYFGADPFSHHCIEMSLYCLMLIGRRMSPVVVENINNSGFRSSPNFIRVLIISVHLKQSEFGLHLLPLLDTRFRALRNILQEELAMSLEESYFRKGLQLMYGSILDHHEMGERRKAERCCRRFLERIRGLDRMGKYGDVAFFGDSVQHLCDIFSMAEMPDASEVAEGCEALMDEIKRENEAENVGVLRCMNGSRAALDGRMSTKESAVVAFERTAVVRIASDTMWQCLTDTEIRPAGGFTILDLAYHRRGVQVVRAMNKRVEVSDDVRYMHVEVKKEHVVYCYERYTLCCKILRNFSGPAVVVFNGNEFSTQSDSVSLDVYFTTARARDLELTLLAEDLAVSRMIRFDVRPSFTFELIHYKYCLPLLYLRVTNHTNEHSRCTGICMRSGNFEVAGAQMLDSVLDLERNSMEYLERQILGADQEFAEIRLGASGAGDDVQKMLKALNRSSDIVADLFFAELVPDLREEVVVRPRKTVLVGIHLRESSRAVHEVLDRDREIEMVSSGRLREAFLQSHEDMPVSPRRMGPFVRIDMEFGMHKAFHLALDETLNEVAILRGMEVTQSFVGFSARYRPFIYMAGAGSIRLNEAAVVYLCISNYYDGRLDIEVSSTAALICEEDRTASVDGFSFALVELRCLFTVNRKCDADDFLISARYDGVESPCDCFVNLPFITQ